MPTLKSVFNKYGSDKIIERLKELYDDIDEDSYREALASVNALEPSSSEGIILLTLVKEDIDGAPLEAAEQWVDVAGRFPDDIYAIEFVPWREWLAMEIDPLTEFSELDIICHCLWEMTWAGYEEETIQSYMSEIEDRAKEAKEHPERLIPWDEVAKKYGLGEDD